MQYNFDEFVDRSGTRASKWDARPDLLPLWVADMDLPCAEPIIQALHKRVDRRIFGYTETLTPAYTGAVLGWMERRFGWQPKAEWIRYSAGVIQAQSCLIHMLSKPGDKIIVQKPVYGPFMMSIETQDRVVSNNALVRCGDHYDMDFDDLAARFADPETVGMILCNPHNPVGRVWTADELRRVLELARANGKWIISDEIHSDIIRAGVTQTPLLSLAGDWADHVYVCTSPSKTFNLAGMQLANTFIPNEDIRRQWDSYVGNTLHVNSANPLSIAAMIAAYTEGDEWLDQANAYIDANLQFLRTYLRERMPKAVMFNCQGTYLAWVDFSAYEPDPARLTQRLQQDAKVFLTEGSAFHETGAFQRINVACPRSLLREGLDRITATLVQPGVHA